MKTERGGGEWTLAQVQGGRKGKGGYSRRWKGTITKEEGGKGKRKKKVIGGKRGKKGRKRESNRHSMQKSLTQPLPSSAEKGVREKCLSKGGCRKKEKKAILSGKRDLISNQETTRKKEAVMVNVH